MFNNIRLSCILEDYIERQQYEQEEQAICSIFIILPLLVISQVQMNQTEFPKCMATNQNIQYSNTLNSIDFNQKSSVTIIKANTYESSRDRTPKIDMTSKSNSSGKLVRVGSAKGINVVSIRTPSSEKQVKQFNTGNNNCIGISSETTIKLNAALVQEIREEIKRANRKYEQKMNQQLVYQHNYLSIEISNLSQMLQENQLKMQKLNNDSNQLVKRIQIIDKKIQTKISGMSKQLSEFRKFYDQCYSYTLKRLFQAERNIQHLASFIDEATQTKDNIQSWKYIQYANSLVRSIISKSSSQSTSLKHYINQQIFELEKKLAKFSDNYQQIHQIVDQMKMVKFENESLKEHVKQLGKYGVNAKAIGKDLYKENLLEYYEPKFKQITKRINNSAIQVDLVKSLIKNQSQIQAQGAHSQALKIEELKNVIKNLEGKIVEDKQWYIKQIGEREQTVSKTNPRILELETKLHGCYEQEAKMLKQISELKLKVSFYQTKCQKNSEREYNIQSTLAQAYSQTLLKQKMKKFNEQKGGLERHIDELQAKISAMDHENYLLAKKLSEISENSQQNKKSQIECKLTIKLLAQIQEKLSKESEKRKQAESKWVLKQKEKNQMEVRIRKLQESLEQQHIQYQNQINILKKRIQQEVVKHNKLSELLKQKELSNQDDDIYFQELEEEVEKCHTQIEQLSNKINQLSSKNAHLEKRNQMLQNDLHSYAQTFEKQSVTFRNALVNLQKEKDFLGIQLKKFSEENKSLRTEIESSKTSQSFYQINSHNSLQLKKAGSVTSYDSQTKPSLQKIEKLERKVISFKDKEDSSLKGAKRYSLKNMIQRLQYDVPLVCELDNCGYLKIERTGKYFEDDNKNWIKFSKKQMEQAVNEGIILL